MTDNLAVIIGTRPEIIKLAPIIHACGQRDIPNCTIIHTGQHYSDALDSVFFDQLELPDPDYNLEVGSGPHGEQTGEMIGRIEEVLCKERPETVLVQGDTNSSLAGAIAASKLDVDLGHVEAGLRSFDREMPEETNRVLADHAADLLFAPSEQSKKNLVAEGISPEQISVTGNTIVDALYQYRTLAADKSNILQELGLQNQEFFVMTAHRTENVDEESRLRSLLDGVNDAAADHGVPIVYPIHPHTKKRLTEFGIDTPDRVRLVEPLDYLDFLQVENKAKLILTDSGGVQEEACILGVPCVTIRDSTERPETVTVGANEIVDPVAGNIAESVDRMVQKSGQWENPFGDGDASKQILQTITRRKKQEIR